MDKVQCEVRREILNLPSTNLKSSLQNNPSRDVFNTIVMADFTPVYQMIPT